jgi:hypothetical protein
MGALGGLFDDFGRHRSAEVDFDGDIVRVKIIAGSDDSVARLCGGSRDCSVGDDGEAAVNEQRANNDPDLIAAAGRVDAHGHLFDEVFLDVVVRGQLFPVVEKGFYRPSFSAAATSTARAVLT